MILYIHTVFGHLSPRPLLAFFSQAHKASLSSWMRVQHLSELMR